MRLNIKRKLFHWVVCFFEAFYEKLFFSFKGSILRFSGIVHYILNWNVSHPLSDIRPFSMKNLVYSSWWSYPTFSEKNWPRIVPSFLRKNERFDSDHSRSFESFQFYFIYRLKRFLKRCDCRIFDVILVWFYIWPRMGVGFDSDKSGIFSILQFELCSSRFTLSDISSKMPFPRNVNVFPRPILNLAKTKILLSNCHGGTPSA